VSVSDSCYVTCPKTKIKVILQYLEEGWLGRAQNRVEGVIFKYDPENDIKLQKIKDVPEEDVIGRIEGSWMDKVYYSLGAQPVSKAEVCLIQYALALCLMLTMSKDKNLIIDVNPLFPEPKVVPPMEQQLPNESRKFWDDVTTAILNKQYSLATQHKTQIEERQRKYAAERKAKGIEWQPRFFTGAVTPVGKPDLTDDGRTVLQGLHNDDFALEENNELGA
jgi:hypothetical protein